MTQENKLELLEINEYGLVAFCKEVEKAIKEGYSFDFDNNLRVPASYGGFMTVTLVKQVLDQALGDMNAKLVDQTEVQSEAVPNLGTNVPDLSTIVVETEALPEVVSNVVTRGRPKNK